MDQEQKKQAAAGAALDYLLERLPSHAVLGIGTGSTVEKFIPLLKPHRDRIEGCVSSSERSSRALQELGIPLIDLNGVTALDFYIDGADEINDGLQMIKGGGGALTREKIIAAVSREFICVADESKWVQQLGTFPLPLEVIPMACAHVARRVRELDGDSRQRADFITDNGNWILDVYDLEIDHPRDLEEELNQIVGVVCNGLFARRPADVLFLGKSSGVDYIVRT